MYIIEKKFTFEAAHLLEGLCEDHPCGTIHGHSYKVQIKIFANRLDSRGFVIDFGDLKRFKAEVIDKLFDHALIVKHDSKVYEGAKKILKMPERYNNTTVENMSHYIMFLLIDFLEYQLDFDNYTKLKVKIYETENNAGHYVYLKS
jgi:6-pyruvoyl tetrahydropterin synthase/QueD family protein